MSFFDRIKNSMGMKSQPGTTGKGNILGTGANANNNNTSIEVSSELIFFEKTFSEAKLGMSVAEYKQRLPTDSATSPGPASRASVSAVHQFSEAYRNGIQLNDIILALNGNELSSFDDFYNFIAGIGRPVTIKFCRFRKAQTPTSQPTTSATTTSNNNAGGVTSIFKNFHLGSNKSSTATTSSSSSQPALTEEEKRQRREMMSKAANTRSQQWDKKVNSAKAKKSENTSPRAVENNFNEEITNPETLRTIQKTKEFESRVEQSLGYSPFRAHMSFTGNESASNAIKSIQAPNSTAYTGNTGIAAPGIANPQQIPIETVLSEEEIDMMIAEVDDAFAMILSLGEEEQETAKVAVQTVYKMLQNLYGNKLDPKFRSIRIGNKAFQSKVASVCGAVELLIAAGYRYQLSEAPNSSSNSPKSTPAVAPSQSTNRYSCDGDELGSANDINEEMISRTPYFQREGFLIHSMELKPEKQLEYTLSRLQELMDIQAQSP